MIGIYKITSPKGKIYIGQSLHIYKRFKEYRKLRCKSQIKLYRSLLKYGVEKHKFELVTECSIDQLNDLERYYQELYNCIKEGLNCSFVNTSVLKQIRSEESRKNISNGQKGRKQHAEWCKSISEGRKGMVFSEEHKINIRLSKTGANNKRSVSVYNAKTGEIYPCIASAAKANNITDKTLSRYLLGTRTNKTPYLKYLK